MIYPKQVLYYLKDRRNEVVNYAELMDEFRCKSRMTISSKIKKLQNAMEPIFPIVTHLVENGRCHLWGGLMYYDRATADDFTTELVHDSVTWLLQCARGLARLERHFLNQPQTKRIILRKQRKKLQKHIGGADEADKIR